MPPAEHQWSAYQQNIFKDIASGLGNTVVMARAGASKTTSIIEGLNYLPKNKTALLVAFNKSIASELRSRAPSYVDCYTFHSIGYAAIRANFGTSVKLDPYKSNKIIIKYLNNLLGENNYNQNIVFFLQQSIGLCKNYLIDTPSKIDEMLDRHGIDFPTFDRDEIVKLHIKILGECKKDKETVDYNDMIYFPFIYNLPLTKYDNVYIDEAQDLTPAQTYIGLSSVKPNGRIFAIGDNFQAIYVWRGSELDTLFKLTKQLNAKVLPLPISYRCAKKIVELAKKYVPDFQAAPNAKEGTIHYISERDLIKKIKPGDFVLSRTNAPLIKYCLSAIKNNIKANIAGKDIGLNLISMILLSKKQKVSAFLSWLEDWKNAEIERLKQKKRDCSIILDKVECLKSLCEGHTHTDNVITNIKTLFKDVKDDEQVVFSTVHKSKGLERKRCFLLYWTFNPDFSQEENNIIYVAITRAKEDLFFVHT